MTAPESSSPIVPTVAAPAAAPTQREEWEVQYLTEFNPRWVRDAAGESAADGLLIAAQLAEFIGRPTRLVHRLITETVVEGPTDG